MTEKKFIKLVEEKSAYISQGKQKIGINKHNLLRKTYNVISSGGILTKYNYIFCIYAITVFSLIHKTQEKLQLKSVYLLNFTIAGHKFKNIPAYERGGKFIQGLFK